jgi:hypothetical protein
MNYNPLKTINPFDTDLTVNSSLWLASRIMPGKGYGKISFTHYKIINDTGARTAELSDFKITELFLNHVQGLIGITNAESLIDLQPSISSLSWKGCWTVNEQAIIGHATAAQGLVAPFNSFNVGYRYKRGWRPNHVN